MKKIQLFLLPFAGGNSASFNKMLPFINDKIECITVEYAGRFTRKDIPFFSKYNDFLYDVASQINIKRTEGLPYAILGYSLGSAIAYDLMIKKLIYGNVEHVFLCSLGDYTDNTKRVDYNKVSEADFLKEIIDLGGMNEQLLANKRFLDIYMRPVRADYIVWGNYYFIKGNIPCDTTVIYSSQDPVAKNISIWANLSSGFVDYFDVGGSHFFINKKYREVADIINKKLII